MNLVVRALTLFAGLALAAMMWSAVAVAAEESALAVSRTDHRPDGNRIAPGVGPLSMSVDVRLDDAPAWVLASPLSQGSDWIVSTIDGDTVLVSADGSSASLDRAGRTRIPKAIVTIDDDLIIVDALDDTAGFSDVLPGARAITAADGTRAVLTGATDRYAHAVLGDALEAASISLLDPDGAASVIEIESDAVVEGLAPIAADLDGDGVDELVVTVSDASAGARLRVYDLRGELVAESDPIGRGFRWRHQIGAGPTGPDGGVELLSVRTPHIGGIVEAFRLIDGRLETVATATGFSSHRIGSPNLDMALLADVDGEGRLELIVPTDDMTRIGVLRRVADTFELVAELRLDGRLATNVAAASDVDGRLVLAVGTEDGRLRIFR